MLVERGAMKPALSLAAATAPGASPSTAAKGPSADGANAGSAPDGAAQPRSVSAFDLSRVRGQYGKAAIVTLQVGVYERTDSGQVTAADLAEIRKAAEDAVAKLRAEGDPAYFLHGPRRSMVTIGVFPEEEVTQKRSAEAAALKKKHPHNLLNGQGYKAGPSGAVRGSEFVRVP
jgi:hypothetical protein